jgi:hypothetical protein
VKQHLKHVAMCAPMIILAAILLVRGSGPGVLIPLAGCLLMMAVMMRAMGGGGGQGGGDDRGAS